MGVILFLVFLAIIAIVACVAVVATIYFNYRTTARLDELKDSREEVLEVRKENHQLRLAVNAARDSMQKVLSDYSHNPKLELLEAIDNVNKMTNVS